MDDGMLAANNISNSTIVPQSIMLSLPISIVIQVFYMALLVRVMAIEGSIWKKPINWMILIDECIRFLGSVGSMRTTLFLGMWLDPGEDSAAECNQSCCIYVYFSIWGSMWSIVGGAGILKFILFHFHLTTAKILMKQHKPFRDCHIQTVSYKVFHDHDGN